METTSAARLVVELCGYTQTDSTSFPELLGIAATAAVCDVDDIVELWVAVCELDDVNVSRLAAVDPALPAAAARVLMSSQWPSVRRLVAQHPGAPLDVLSAAAKNMSWPLERAAVAANPSTPRELLVELYGDDHVLVEEMAKTALLARSGEDS
jgi:hypothetical protein